MTHSELSGLLADTWWFGLTSRLSDADFKMLAARRAAQGFSAIQLVVGVPPEVGPANENAKSPVGFPWTLDGQVNEAYLQFARDRILYLNTLGLTAVVYGAWGHQIAWLGQEMMSTWWRKIIETLDDLEVIYCLCGESNLWLGQEEMLLPDKTTSELPLRDRFSRLPPTLRAYLSAVAHRLWKWLHRRQREARRQAWGFVLEEMARHTDRPIIVHPMADETGYDAVPNPERLAVNTAQTGHDARARNRLWRLPLHLQQHGRASKGYINLEPWYEGIGDQFWTSDQLYAYWVSMLAGATGHCYGAQGIWNVGDGEFLAHWGKQTFAQAVALDTPRLIGLSHQQFLQHHDPASEVFYQTRGKELITIGRKHGEKLVQFFPDVARADHVPVGDIWLPLKGAFADTLPSQGPVVISRES
ncbi:MAG: DUF4038 domain-containing protein [Anaerolineae bacterium]|nr:DUF4038 domain-containing protein [Anaerolineae bacterium]